MAGEYDSFWDSVSAGQLDQFTGYKPYEPPAPPAPPPLEQPGFSGSFNSALASQVGGVGAIGRYAGVSGAANLEQRGNEYASKNYAPPMDTSSLGALGHSLATQPWETAKELAGSTAGYVVPSMIAAAVASRAPAVAAAAAPTVAATGLGALLLRNAPKIAAGLTFGTPMAGNTLSAQKALGIDEPWKAAGVGAVGALAFPALGVGKALLRPAERAAMGVGERMLKTSAEQAAVMPVFTAANRWGVNKDLLSPEAISEYSGAAGTGALIGLGVGAIPARKGAIKEPEPEPKTELDLANKKSPSTPIPNDVHGQGDLFAPGFKENLYKTPEPEAPSYTDFVDTKGQVKLMTTSGRAKTQAELQAEGVAAETPERMAIMKHLTDYLGTRAEDWKNYVDVPLAELRSYADTIKNAEDLGFTDAQTKERANALQKQSAGEVLQRESVKAGETGDKRGSLEQGIQGQEVAAKVETGAPYPKGEIADLEKRLDNLMTSHAAPTRADKADVPGHAPLSEAQVQFVADQLRQAEDVHGKTPSIGPYAKLFDALKTWSSGIKTATGAKSRTKQAEHFGKLLEGNAVTDVRRLLSFLEDEFGTHSTNKIIKNLKSTGEKPGIDEIPPHARLAAAWSMFKDGTLEAHKGVSAAADKQIRGNWLEEKLNARIKAEGGYAPTKLEERLGKGKEGVVKFLEKSAWQGFSADIQAVSHALHTFFKSGRVLIPHIEIHDKKGVGPDGRQVFGTYDAMTHTVHIYEGGHNSRTVLHELLHGATVNFILTKPRHPAVDQLAKSLGAMTKLHDTEFKKFLSTHALDVDTRERLDTALRNTVDAFKSATTLKGVAQVRARTKAIAEFVTYGMMDPEFQAYMKELKIPKIEGDYGLNQNLKTNRVTGLKTTVAKNAILTVWSRFINAMSYIINGREYGKAGDLNMLDQFLSDSARLLEAAYETPIKEPGAGKAAPVYSESPKTSVDRAVEKKRLEKLDEHIAKLDAQLAKQGLAKSRKLFLRKARDIAMSQREDTLAQTQGDLTFASETRPPAPGEDLNTDKLPVFDQKWARTDSVVKSFVDSTMGYSGKVEALGKKAEAMTVTFDRTFPEAGKIIRWIDHTFGIPDLAEPYAKVEARGHAPKAEANLLAGMLDNMPLETQQPVLDYLDGHDVKLAEHTKDYADNFKRAFDKLEREYVEYTTPKDLEPGVKSPEREALERKLQSLNLTDKLIYISDPTKTRGQSMNASPITDWMETNRASIEKDLVIGLELEGKFYQRVEKLPDGTLAPAGFVHESQVRPFSDNAPSNEKLDMSKGWLLKGGDAANKDNVVFTSNMSYAEALKENKAATHSAAIRNTIDQMDRVVTSARYAEQTVEFGSKSGLVYDSREALEVDHPRLKGRPIYTIGKANSASQNEQNFLRRSDQWIEVPADSTSQGAMAGKFINGSVWGALADIHYSQPAIKSPAFNASMRWFKQSKTKWSLGTHLINAGSNVVWAYFHDIPVSAIKDGVLLYVKAMTYPGSMTVNEKALWSAFKESGALIADYSVAELRKILSDSAIESLGKVGGNSIWHMTEAMALYEKAKASRIVKLAGKADDIAQKLYAGEDNAFRLAAFMSKAASLEHASGRPVTPAELQIAARAASTEFLDYNIHARGINTMKQTVLPFISWPYRALPALVKVALYKPWKLGGVLGAVTMLDAASVAMTGGSAADKKKRKVLPSYMNQRLFGFGPRMYLQVPGMGTEQKPVYFKLGAFVPVGDLIQNDGRNGFMGQTWFPSQFTPNGPIISALAGAVFGVDPFTGQPISQTTDSLWSAFGKRAAFLEGQMMPPALDVKRGAETWSRVVNDKHGPLGGEYDKNIELLRLVGLRIVQVDIAEAAYRQRRAVKAIEMQYRKELSKVTREALQHPNRNPADLVETRKALMERKKADIARVKNVE